MIYNEKKYNFLNKLRTTSKIDSIIGKLKICNEMNDENLFNYLKDLNYSYRNKMYQMAISINKIDLANRIAKVIEKIQLEQIKKLMNANGKERKIFTKLSYDEKIALSRFIKSKNDTEGVSDIDKELLQKINIKLENDLIESAKKAGYDNIEEWEKNNFMIENER